MTATTKTAPKTWYCVQVYDLAGKWIGRLTPDGAATRLTIHAVMLDKETAAEVADEINDEGAYRAKVKPF